jgi:hypothetical protein
VDGQQYLLDKYGMASTLELEWWQTPSTRGILIFLTFHLL